ncbi:hypothetical protein LOTGIDRAFT_224981 [Lottia gigantea]|uniref:Secernin-2 n=1 Tax=Lottia gigantea TaxID=225164 RepID=V4CJ56_LOTGI|nr:hypothetical protein LOTGIDRAFT_224981 [Lottia gigantea]ESP02240.1 hypothetical protein LOTGIDRAFT_224981 [Lottia gigantea]
MSDIFVALPPATGGTVIFGKNADRPPSEVQEIVYCSPKDNPEGSKVKCTFMEIDQVTHISGVVLSKAAWTWGAEMGANEHGVCAGNTSVWTKLCTPGDHNEKLLGVDLVRLCLERGKSSKEAMLIVTELLEKYGQGGHSCEDPNFGQWTYNNSFLFADRHEAWKLDTAGQYWVAKKITQGTENISSILTIETDYDLCSDGLKEKAEKAGFYKPESGELNFYKTFHAAFSAYVRLTSQCSTNKPMLYFIVSDEFSQHNMFQILRNEPSSINFSGELVTMASQVSVLQPQNGSMVPDVHWFTGTPNPSLSVFKPFIFSDQPVIGDVTIAPAHDGKPTFQTVADRRHTLFKAHEKGRKLMEEGTPNGKRLLQTMKSLEIQCVLDVSEYLQNFDKTKLDEVHDLFKDLTESEVKFYV